VKDRFYDYSSFADERLKEIMTGWDGFGGYHGLLIKLIASLIPIDSTILDVGCGLCHLWEAMVEKTKFFSGPVLSYYMGIDIDPRVVRMAKERYPHLPIVIGSVYNLSNLGEFDAIVACGLYSDEPEKSDGIEQMLEHVKFGGKLIITYFHKEKGKYPEFFSENVREVIHDIDPRLTILEIYPDGFRL